MGTPHTVPRSPLAFLSDYMCAMSDAVFCLAPRGQAAWSPRLDEAIAAGCIPVIIADFYDPPFQGVFEYAAFSVRISESDVCHPTNAGRFCELARHHLRRRTLSPFFFSQFTPLRPPCRFRSGRDTTRFLKKHNAEGAKVPPQQCREGSALLSIFGPKGGVPN